MITKEKLGQMHSIAVDQIEMTTQELKAMGFNSNDLTKMVREGQLDRIRTGFYVVPAKNLYQYGKDLLKDKAFDRAYQCFKACYELEPNNVNTLLQLFYQSIVREDYEGAFKYFDGIFASNDDDQNNIADNYLYLYLLGYITDIPDKYRTLIDSIDFNDIEYKKQTLMYPDLDDINGIRQNVFEHKFKPLIIKLQKMSQARNYSSIRESILKVLLKHANKEQTKDTNLIASYIHKKDYESLMLTLEAEKEKRGLSSVHEYLLVLAHDYLEIMHTGRIPQTPNFGINNTFNAISHKDYRRALELFINRSKSKDIPVQNQILYQPLLDINELIRSLSNTIDSNGQVVLYGFDHQIDEEGEQLEIPGFREAEVTYADVVSSLIGKKKEDAEGVLTKYFEQKGIVKYRFIIDTLLDICTLENDLSYSKAMIELANIGSPKYKIDLSSYSQGFYLALNGALYDIAEKYLSIIEGANGLVPNKIDVSVLKAALENKKNKKEEPIVKVEQPKKVETTSATDKVQKVVSPRPVEDADEKLVQAKISVFETGEDVVILKAMDNTRRKKIHSIVASIPNVKSFNIGSGQNKKIVLNNSPYVEGRIDKRALSIEGDTAYREQDYEKCIECYRTLLYLVRPDAKVYGKLGLAYMKRNEIKKAIKYLTIATELSKVGSGKYDFTELIAKLKGKSVPEVEEVKPKFTMSESEFESGDNYYGVEHIAEVSRMVFAENMTLEEACQVFNYDENQMNVIRLIYAEEYYSAGDYKAGDALVKVVNNAKGKSKRVKRILGQVNSRKKFYKNRPREISFVYMYK